MTKKPNTTKSLPPGQTSPVTTTTTIILTAVQYPDSSAIIVSGPLSNPWITTYANPTDADAQLQATYQDIINSITGSPIPPI